MPDSHWLNLGICTLLSLTVWFGLFRLKGLLGPRWKEAVAVAVVSGFVAYLGYLIVRVVASHFGLAPGRWVILPVLVLVVWVYHDMLFRPRP
jgi:hypothetical protein